MKKNNNKGFTLAELLIVVAIIAVLVAISIPIFSSQLEKARDATSVANMRSAYAEAQVSFLTESDNGNATYDSTAKTVTVDKVVIKTKEANEWSGQAADLPFTAPADAGTTSEEKTKLVFTYVSGALSSVAFGD